MFPCHGLRIQHYHCSSLGHCCGMGLIPGPGNSTNHGHGQKKKRYTVKNGSAVVKRPIQNKEESERHLDYKRKMSEGSRNGQIGRLGLRPLRSSQQLLQAENSASWVGEVAYSSQGSDFNPQMSSPLFSFARKEQKAGLVGKEVRRQEWVC